MPLQLKSPIKPEAVRSLTADEVDAAVLAVPPFPGGFSGRGITVCAGGLTYFTNAWVLIRMLRHFGCELPVQFWYYGPEELDDRMQRLVEPYGVECVDAQRKAKEIGSKISQGWPLKPFSILHSPFEEVLALDADNMPIRDPEYLFESNAYLETGAMFWPDVGRTTPDKEIWKLMRVPYSNEPEFESGQIVINKALVWEPLKLTMWMNEEGRADFFYQLIWGDKDTFRFAWHKFGFPFAMTEIPVQMLNVRGGPCCAGVMCQHDLDGERIFQHRNALKWDLFRENPWVPGFLFEGEVREFLSELKANWDGRIGQAPRSKKPPACVHRDKLINTIWLMETESNGTTGTGNPPNMETEDFANAAHATKNGCAPASLISMCEPAGPIAGALPVHESLAIDSSNGSPLSVVAEHANTVAKPETVDQWPRANQRRFREMRFDERGHLSAWSDAAYTFWDIQTTDKDVMLVLSGVNGVAAPTAKFKLQKDRTWKGKEVGSKNGAKFHLRPLEHVFPALAESSSQRQHGPNVHPPIKKKSSPRIHVFNSAFGIGDHITAVYACVGAANAGYEVVFHTRFPTWLERVRHPGLTITGDLPPGVGEDGILSESKLANVIDVNYDVGYQLRFAGDRARWYAAAIHPDLRPARPAMVDRSIRIPRFDFNRYVLLVPFAAWSEREWPGVNWARLTHLLRNAGYEVVVDGMEHHAERFVTVFNETTAFWAIGNPPEWLSDAMLGATAVIANDSGAAHVAGLLDVPTIAIHAHLPPEFLFAHTNVSSISPKTNCTFCRWQPDRGYTSACKSGCSAMSGVSPEDVLNAFLKLRQPQPAAPFQSTKQRTHSQPLVSPL